MSKGYIGRLSITFPAAMLKVQFDADDFQRKVLTHAREQAASHVQARLSAVRHPVTGEFPTVHVSVLPDGNLSVHVEASEELRALVLEKLTDTAPTATLDTENTTPNQQDAETIPMPPRVFLSFAYEDHGLAKIIAEKLMAAGINVWWADWEIKAGDSLRRKIDAGLGECSHFVALLTPKSIQKPWVQEELDAGFMRKLEGVTFIPLRSGLDVKELPPLLRGLNSPKINPENIDLTQLTNDIHGITRKPKLGPFPEAARATSASSAPCSPAAMTLAKLFIEQSPHAWKARPVLDFDEIVQRTGLTEDDIRDGVHELDGLLTVHNNAAVYPEEELFVRMDQHFKTWEPSKDALAVAVALMEDTVSGDPESISKHFEWDTRRLNPALAYLANRNLVKFIKGLTGGNFSISAIMKTDATRRFVKSRQ